MTYPLISEYVAAIQNAADNLDKLSGLKPVMDSHGEPVHSSGAFAVVFKMVDKNGKYFALKCFTEEQTGRDEAYRLIADELNGIESKYLTSVRYYDKELFVDSNVSDETVFPVLLMDWIEGETMDVYIAENYQDKYTMEWLCYRFCKMAAWLRSQTFAHGVIKPDNIIVGEDGELTLIDYDGMFVPAMKGWKSPTLGTKDFDHPNRKIEDFDETIDDFTLASIALSLKAISLDSTLYDRYRATDRLLFSAEDYLNFEKCEVVHSMQSLMSDSEFKKLYALFMFVLSYNNLSYVSFQSFQVMRPNEDRKQTIEEIKKLCQVTEEEKEHELKYFVEWDDSGAKYSKDGTRLIKVDNRSVKGEFKIKNGTKIICNDAFNWCIELTSIYIPSSIIGIGENAFEVCQGLTSINIPSSVTYIGKGAFSHCCNISSFIIPPKVTRIEAGTFYGCGGLTSIIIPSNVTSIGNFAFYDCIHLTSIIIPSNVTYIGKSAFYRCRSLASITIPSKVTCIDDDTFYECNCLTSIEIPTNVTSIGNLAFYRCKNLTSVIIPPNITHIGRGAFSHCSCLASITIPSTITSIEDYTFVGCAITSIIIPHSVNSIGDYSFWGCRNLKSISIPTNVNRIGNGAFNDCISLESISIPPNLTSIENGVFDHCRSLKSISIPASVNSIGDCAFSCCYELMSVTIPPGVNYIGKMAFFQCSKLKSIFIKKGSKQHFIEMLPYEKKLLIETDPYTFLNIDQPTNYHPTQDEIRVLCEVTDEELQSVDYDENGALYSKDGKRLLRVKNNINSAFRIKEGTKVICNKAFCYREKLISVEIPSSVIIIGERAFHHCTNLKSVTIPSNVISLGCQAFRSCTNLTSIVIQPGLTFLADRTFANCISLSTINLPSTIINIGKRAFDSCSNLTSITLPPSVKNIGDCAFYSCKSLSSIILPSDLSTIECGLFNGCKNLSTIVIPSKVKCIGNGAFYRCYGLKSVTLPSDLTSIGDSAFELCGCLTSINIPPSVTSIGERALLACTNITVSNEMRQQIINAIQNWRHNQAKIDNKHDQDNS